MSILRSVMNRESINSMARIFAFIPDEPYLKMMYRLRTGKRLNLEAPRRFNEKIQWLKLHDRRPEYTMMVDKYSVKPYVASIIGEEFIIPTLGVWDRFDDIDFAKLPDQFVLKCTHDSGGLVICKDKSKLDMKKARKKIERSLKSNFFWIGREWPYKDVPHRIIAEQYLEDESGEELKDYKIFCFNGEPKYIQVDFGRFSNHERNVYSTDWKYMGFTSHYKSNPNVAIPRPEKLDKMLAIAKVLSVGIKQVRIDLYSVFGRVYFGEVTFYHGSGFVRYEPDEWDERLGRMIELA